MTLNHYHPTQIKSAVPIFALTAEQLQPWLLEQPLRVRNWVKNSGFCATPEDFCLLANEEGQLERVLVGIDDPNSMWQFAHLPMKLPQADYYIENDFGDQLLQQLVIAWGLGRYCFDKYKRLPHAQSKLIMPRRINEKAVDNVVQSYHFGRDLINTSAEDLGPSELADMVLRLGHHYGAVVDQISGQALIDRDYKAVYAVGRASHRVPRLIDLHWGNIRHPAVTLVGKGVCFDSGGLALKPLSSMLLMKKDMGGAAHVLSLAKMIMTEELPIHLRVIIPAVDNVISSNAYRPGDVLEMRNKKTVEIHSTDAEGRLILADALVEGATDKPRLLIDFATLGGAYMALGAELPALFSSSSRLAADIEAFSILEQDPLCRLPLHQGYRHLLDSDIADLRNNAQTPCASAITTALFLQEFVPAEIDWLHFDITAWNLTAKSGRPCGGELMAIRALFSYLRHRFSVQH